MLDQYKIGFLEYVFIKWQTRALGAKLDKMIILLPILVCIGMKEDLEKTIQNIRKIVFKNVKSKRIADMVFKRIMFKAQKYANNQETFCEMKQKVYEMITQNIQMFSLVLDALDGVNRELGRITMIIKKSYEENFDLTGEAKRLLDYQERRFFTNENIIK